MVVQVRLTGNQTENNASTLFVRRSLRALVLGKDVVNSCFG